MSTLHYVRVIPLGSMVEPGAKRRSRRKEGQVLRNGDWIEGMLTTPIRIGQGFGLRVIIHNGQLCRKIYVTSAVVAIQGDQVLTCEVRYKFLRVPVFDATQSLKSWDES